ncbi:MAG: hypothetical protein ACR2PT_19860 [Endozoicomonas sp.]
MTVFPTFSFSSSPTDLTTQGWELFIQPQLFEQVTTNQSCIISLDEQSDLDMIQLEPGCTLTAAHGTSIPFTPPLNLSKITLVISSESYSPTGETFDKNSWQQTLLSTGKSTAVRPSIILTVKAAPKNTPLIIVDDQTEISSLGLELPAGTDPTKTGILRITEKTTPDLLRELYFRHSSKPRMQSLYPVSGDNGDDPGYWWWLNWCKKCYCCKPRTIPSEEGELGNIELPEAEGPLRSVVSDKDSIKTFLEMLQPPDPVPEDADAPSPGGDKNDRPANPIPEEDEDLDENNELSDE